MKVEEELKSDESAALTPEYAPELKLGEAALQQRTIEAPVAPIQEEEEEEAGQAPVSPLMAGAAGFFGSAAAGWMVAGVFTGVSARFIALLCAFIGGGAVALSYKTKRPMTIQFLVLPLALLIGGALVAPDTTGGSANLPSLVVEALKSGGLSQPPVPFDPGWRFLLVLLISSLAVAAASAPLATGRPRLAAFIPAPVTIAGILIQPKGAEVLSVSVALVLTVASLAVTFGAELAQQGATGGSFEIRRFGRAAAIVGVIVALLISLSRFGALFPEEQESKVIPPKRPQTPPAAVDRLVFTVESPVSVPWRLGVLDVYDKTAWLTPPYDPNRFKNIPKSGRIPGALTAVPPEKRMSVKFSITDLEGRVAPNIASPITVKGAPLEMDFDPRVQSFRLPGRARAGTVYTVEGPLPADAEQLLKAPPPPASMKPFLALPPPPAEVQDLLNQVPLDVPMYEKLQFVRTKFFESVIAAGAGNPRDVPPARVADMLAGSEASPYEITAAEVMLARWVGVPARVGYGYYGGEKVGNVVEVHTKHGAMWLEAYFEGSGWVPIVGRPPRAKSSLSRNQKNEEPEIRPTDELGAVVYVPLRLQRITLLYVLVQYWLSKAAPWVGLGLLVLAFYPGLLKIMRRARRRRWAYRHGARERIAAAYADLRDFAIDLNLGHPSFTPIEFLDVTIEDEDHRQLAWLVSRAIWGDLQRDVRIDDVEQCEAWARSVRKRLSQGQSPLMRTLAIASRASLKDPYSAEMPNMWLPWSPRKRAAAAIKRFMLAALRPWRLLRLLRPKSATAMLLVLVVLFASGCLQDVNLKARPSRLPALPEVPDALGDFRFERDSNGAAAFEHFYDVSLVAKGELFAIRDTDGVVQGTLQTAVFKPTLRSRTGVVRQGVLKAVGGGAFKPTRLGRDTVFALRLPEQRILMWFDTDVATYQILVATQGFDQAEQLLASLLAKQRGEDVDQFSRVLIVPPIDPRRGSP